MDVFYWYLEEIKGCKVDVFFLTDYFSLTESTELTLSPTDYTDLKDFFFFDSLFDYVKCALRMTQIFYRCSIVFFHRLF